MDGFVLNGSTLAGIGALLGALSGAITFLFKEIMKSKDAEIAAIKEANMRLIIERDARATERDHFRDTLLKALEERPKRWNDPENIEPPPPRPRPSKPRQPRKAS